MRGRASGLRVVRILDLLARQVGCAVAPPDRPALAQRHLCGVDATAGEAFRAVIGRPLGRADRAAGIHQFIDEALPTLFGQARIGRAPQDAVDEIARELVPDLTDRLAFLRGYVAEHAPQAGEPVTDKPHRRVIGQVETSFRGVGYTGGVQPYTFFLWQRLIEAARHPAAKALFAEHGLSSLIVDLPIRVARRDNIEVWA